MLLLNLNFFMPLHFSIGGHMTKGYLVHCIFIYNTTSDVHRYFFLYAVTRVKIFTPSYFSQTNEVTCCKIF